MKLKNNKILIREINIIMLSIFIFISVFFPYDFYGLKKISFILLILLNSVKIIEAMLIKKYMLITFFGFIFPTITICISALLTGNLSNSFSRGFSMYILLLLIIILLYNIEIEKILIWVLTSLAILIVTLVILDMVKIANINDSSIRDFIYKHNMGFIGASTTYTFYYKVFFRSSPLLILPLMKYLSEKKYILFTLILLAMLFTGTRANFIMAILSSAIYLIVMNRNKFTIYKYTVFIIGILLIIFALSRNIDVIIDKFVLTNVGSDMVRKGHIDGFKALILKNPITLIMGTGLGSYYESYSVGWTSSIELSYIDLIRQIGVPLFLIYIIFYIYPIINMNVTKYKKYAYTSYIIIAATNPLLINSTGYIMYVYIYQSIYKKIRSV